MKHLTTAAFFVVVSPFILSSNEPSAFGAGDITNPNPYGLTQNEKVILETKKNLHKVVVKSRTQADEVDSLRSRLDGFQTIIEGIGRKSYENRSAIEKLKEQSAEDKKSANEYDKRLSEISQSNVQDIQKLSTQVETNRANIEKITLALSELSKLIATMNSSVVTKDEFTSLVNDFNTFKSVIAKNIANGVAVATSPLEKMPNSDVDNEAIKYFDSKQYDKAQEYYLHLIKNNYRPAHSHYRVGEVYYNKKDYGNAISYFKKSASLYSKASYMPSLMLHTAISMHRTKDLDNAKKFYNAVVAKYPNSSESKEALKQLSSMK